MNPLILILVLFMVFSFIQGGQLPPILGEFFRNPAIGLSMVAGLIIGITIHEFAHAFVAYRLGDPTAKVAGRLTLNPLAHLDPIGTVALLLIGVGWGKPTPFDPYNLRNVKRDSALISAAGAAVNLALALILSIPYLTAYYLHMANPAINSIYTYLSPIIFFNVILGIFNLIPISPLDGFKVLAGLLPRDWYYDFIQTEKYGIFFLLILLATGAISKLLFPIVSTVLGFLMPGFTAPF